MSGDTNTSILNRGLKFLLMGKQEGRETDIEKPVAITQNRELKIFAPLTGLSADGETFTALYVDGDRKLWIRNDEVLEFPDPVFLDNAAPSVVYSPPPGFNARVEVEITNDDTGTQTFSLWIDPSGTTTSGAFRRIRDYNQEPNSIPVRLGEYELDENGQIAGQASAATSISVQCFVKLYRTT